MIISAAVCVCVTPSLAKRRLLPVAKLTCDNLTYHSFHYNFRKFSFAARVVNVWNSLPDCVLDVNNSLKQFETRLNKFCGNQDVI